MKFSRTEDLSVISLVAAPLILIMYSSYTDFYVLRDCVEVYVTLILYDLSGQKLLTSAVRTPTVT
jgi:hypothetical protein